MKKIPLSEARVDMVLAEKATTQSGQTVADVDTVLTKQL